MLNFDIKSVLDRVRNGSPNERAAARLLRFNLVITFLPSSQGLRAQSGLDV